MVFKYANQLCPPCLSVQYLLALASDTSQNRDSSKWNIECELSFCPHSVHSHWRWRTYSIANGQHLWSGTRTDADRIRIREAGRSWTVHSGSYWARIAIIRTTIAVLSLYMSASAEIRSLVMQSSQQFEIESFHQPPASIRFRHENGIYFPIVDRLIGLTHSLCNGWQRSGKLAQMDFPGSILTQIPCVSIILWKSDRSIAWTDDVVPWSSIINLIGFPPPFTGGWTRGPTL